MVILLVFASFVLFVVADIAVRSVARSMHEKRLRKERAEVLAVSLKLDFTREAKSLKRAEVKEPAARILCVDDEKVILDSFRKILVLDGYCVDTVETGQEALGLVQARNYDFVFTDLKMPSMDGVDVVKSVKHMRPDVDVIVITGYATVESAVECMKFGAMDYVQKPFTEDELLAFTKKALIKRRDRIQKQLKPKVHITALPKEETMPAGEFLIPGGVLISKGHCWASMSQDGSVKVGLDDFAKKIIGHIDDIELPNVGMTVKAGQPLFTVRQKGRRVQFSAPVGGQIVKVNAALGADGDALEVTPYQKNWTCVIDADNLDKDLPALKIGKSAVSLFEDDIDHFRRIMRDLAKQGDDGQAHVGDLEQLDETQWERVVGEFFRR